ncbi:MAG: hypothetical protein K6B16_06185 [Bacteroidales bacterium]|nr:hypothetical protein [Bacteroidales bacterium]
MGNIDEKTLSAILGRIDSIREELEALEYEVKAILEPAVAEEPEAVVEPELTAEPEPVEEPAPVEEPVPAEEPEPVDVMDDIPQEPIDLSISDIDIPEEEPVETAKTILDTAKADTAVMDVLAERQAWRIDRPGSAVKNVISAISLNDRVLLINVLFGEDPMLFQDTISAFNGMQTLDEATAYIKANFPDWDMDSEPVYRLMMAVRRKLR